MVADSSYIRIWLALVTRVKQKKNLILCNCLQIEIERVMHGNSFSNACGSGPTTLFCALLFKGEDYDTINCSTTGLKFILRGIDYFKMLLMGSGHFHLTISSYYHMIHVQSHVMASIWLLVGDIAWEKTLLDSWGLIGHRKQTTS